MSDFLKILIPIITSIFSAFLTGLILGLLQNQRQKLHQKLLKNKQLNLLKFEEDAHQKILIQLNDINKKLEDLDKKINQK
jgi:hypothetical protein